MYVHIEGLNEDELVRLEDTTWRVACSPYEVDGEWRVFVVSRDADWRLLRDSERPSVLVLREARDVAS